MKRFSNALCVGPETLVSDLAARIQDAQREIYAEQGGGQAVRTDPAARWMLHQLGSRLNVAELDNEFTSYALAVDLVEKKIAAPEQDVAHRRWLDAQSAQQGAVNVGALAGSIARYALQMEANGIETHDDTALKMIAHQMASLCEQVTTPDAEAQVWQHACRAMVAGQAAREAVTALDPQPLGLQPR